MTGVGRNMASTADDAVRGILGTLLSAEQLMTTFYYAALTTPAILHDARLCGAKSADPNSPGLPPGGNPTQVRYLQAALDAEAKHATALRHAGAVAAADRFYFPANAFHMLGSPSYRSTFLGVLDTLETVCVGAYLVAAMRFQRLGRPDLTMVAARVMGVESEHRMLGRAIGGVLPANNLTLARAPFRTVDDVNAALRPYLSGKGFHVRVTGAVRMPTEAHIKIVVGNYGTRVVRRFQ